MIDAKVGDVLVRNMAGIKIPVTVTAVTEKLVICGNDEVPGGDEKRHVGWWFDRETGAEVDEDLDWGPPPLSTGSFIDVGQPVMQLTPEQVFEMKEKFIRSGG